MKHTVSNTTTRPPSLPKVFSSRHSGGRSVMILYVIVANGKTNLAVIRNKMSSKRYITVLEQFLILFSYFNYGVSWHDVCSIQDDSSVHRSDR